MSEWISVDVDLPKEDGRYKTKSAYYKEGKKMLFKTKINLSVNNKNVWFADKTSPTSSVTHWAPN